MCNDTLLWLFSTISQTLAALIAVVGVVVVFRIDNMSRALTRLIDRNLDSLRRLIGRGALRTEAESLPKFAKHYDEHKNQDIDGHDDLATEGKVVTYWRSSEKQFGDIRTTLKWFFIIGLSTMFVSILFLPFTEFISGYRKLSISLVVAVLVGSTGTLVFTALSFFRLLGKFLVNYKGEHIKQEMIK